MVWHIKSENDKRSLPIGKNKKKKSFFQGWIRTKYYDRFAGLKAKTCAYLLDDAVKRKKLKEQKKCVIKRILKFNNYEDCLLLNNKIILKSQQRFKSDYYNVYTEQVNKIVLSINDDKRWQAFDKITNYTYGTNTFKVYQSEMLSKYKWLILMIMQMKTNRK